MSRPNKPKGRAASAAGIPEPLEIPVFRLRPWQTRKARSGAKPGFGPFYYIPYSYYSKLSTPPHIFPAVPVLPLSQLSRNPLFFNASGHSNLAKRSLFIRLEISRRPFNLTEKPPFPYRSKPPPFGFL